MLGSCQEVVAVMSPGNCDITTLQSPGPSVVQQATGDTTAQLIALSTSHHCPSLYPGLADYAGKLFTVCEIDNTTQKKLEN